MLCPRPNRVQIVMPKSRTAAICFPSGMQYNRRVPRLLQARNQRQHIRFDPSSPGERVDQVQDLHGKLAVDTVAKPKPLAARSAVPRASEISFCENLFANECAE